MPCGAPIKAYRPATGGPVRFQLPSDGRAYIPFDLPCGYCIVCREEQARQWAVRIYHEAMNHEENSFITLTYSDAALPPYGGLRYEDLVRFHKRLRKRYGTLRHFSVGEYGDKSFRPHYHACIFGHAFTRDRIILRETPTLLWTCPELEQAWGHGNVSVGALNFQTARYTASYITKKLRSKQTYVRLDELTGELIPLEQPKSIKSDNLGKTWWKENGHFVSAHDYVVINGQKQKPPKAYDKWLGDKNKIPLQMIKDQRVDKSKTTSTEKSHARALNARARVNRKTKNI